MKLYITKKMLDEIVKYTKQKIPYEACGILSGDIAEENYRVKRIWTFENELSSAFKFYVNKEKVKSVMSSIDQLNEHLIVVFHSHPTAHAIPSFQDIYYHIDSKILMMIISLKEEIPDVKCYHITGNKYVKCELITVEL
ncbi:hypothetical protein J6TS2_03650 [Heyndrickxia sporothermodurans]|nr:hypothetical protein J6TS2_03650 [Heyndrickxia sporothermodurans]